MASVVLLQHVLLHAAALGYVNNFPEADNAFGVKLPPRASVREDSFAFLIADFGLPPPGTAPAAAGRASDGWSQVEPGKCCQTDVAEMMRAKREDLEAAGKSLLFVGAAGDNFYHSGLLDEDKGGELQWARWSAVYAGLTDVPWFAAFGNHDLGDSDLYATCPEKAPRVTIGGQAYASNQLDASKGGYRPPQGNTTAYHLPDFNYRTTLNALNLEIYGIDQNYKDVSGIGGNNSTHQRVNAVCGGGNGALGTRLAAIGHSGEALLASGAAKGASDPNSTRNVLVLQHYPGLCASLKAKFVAALPAGEQQHLDFKCSFGHVHNTTCESGNASACEFAMIGGGGGCCATDVVNSQAGFGLLTFNRAGGMNIELLRLGRHCNMAPMGYGGNGVSNNRQ